MFKDISIFKNKKFCIIFIGTVNDLSFPKQEFLGQSVSGNIKVFLTCTLLDTNFNILSNRKNITLIKEVEKIEFSNVNSLKYLDSKTMEQEGYTTNLEISRHINIGSKVVFCLTNKYFNSNHFFDLFNSRIERYLPLQLEILLDSVKVFFIKLNNQPNKRFQNNINDDLYQPFIDLLRKQSHSICKSI